MKKKNSSDLKRLSTQEFKKMHKVNASILLDSVRSAHNVGSVFRTCDAFGIKHLYLAGITASPPHKEINKTALGAQKSVDWDYHDNINSLAAQLKKKNKIIIAVEQVEKSNNLKNFYPKNEEDYVFIFGNEVYGVSDDILKYVDDVVEIPQFGTKHSLNIAVSVGIVMWDFISKTKPLQ